MRSIRPLRVFAIAVLSMWWFLAARFWFADSVLVWSVSSAAGAWMPLLGAALFLYVREEGDREDGLAAAWLVRVLGMQTVLVWALGMADWLRGPPDAPPAIDTDLAGPVILVSFAPAVLASLWTLARLAALLRGHKRYMARPVASLADEVALAPFRAMGALDVEAPPARFPLAPLCAATALSLLALRLPASPLWVIGVGALAFALCTAVNQRAVVPSVAGLAMLSAVVGARTVSAGSSGVTLAVAWPWITTSALALYLAACGALVRLRSPRRAPVRTRPPRALPPPRKGRHL